MLAAQTLPQAPQTHPVSAKESVLRLLPGAQDSLKSLTVPKDPDPRAHRPLLVCLSAQPDHPDTLLGLPLTHYRAEPSFGEGDGGSLPPPLPDFAFRKQGKEEGHLAAEGPRPDTPHGRNKSRPGRWDVLYAGGGWGFLTGSQHAANSLPLLGS